MAAGNPQKLPQDPVLARLLAASRQISGSETIVHDAFGFEKTYPELLGDVMQMRHLLRARLPPSAVGEQGFFHEAVPYVAVLARSGYELIVAFFAIRAMGGAWMTFGSGILPEEAYYFLSKTKATCMLASKDCFGRAEKICAYLSEQKDSESLTLLPISSDAQPLGNADIAIEDSLPVDSGGPGLVLFTSGTTGLPKATVLPKRCFAYAQLAEPGSAAINYRPGHWIGGARSLIEPVVTGTKLYDLGEKAGADTVLEAFKTHRITHATFTPLVLRQMKDLMTDGSGELSKEGRKKYSNYFKGLPTIRCAAGILGPTTMQFWTDLTGLPFENVYSSTELGGPATRAISGIKKNSIGTPLPGIDVKLSEGDHGELRVKSPNMLTHYIGEEEATRDAFDDEGYFKTGDLAYLKDGEFVFAGRSNADYVFFRFYQISTLRTTKRKSYAERSFGFDFIRRQQSK
ncbi:AMP-binding enzyme [Hirsutella rhossiliensis]|uniref:AMP-binding enzyme domain-containing protein n=1 Tax=Hirsutella rhossiliensis TaxID=111463 RepID=A0A9P8SNW9_9HYPO|nr:AMP-binding enzyme domain-containing protein [Hirsutella rhossiliensis]KAH0967566.1 AMP-binding enzyme domain-containing protein [Hirsutella rhossiliensis]